MKAHQEKSDALLEEINNKLTMLTCGNKEYVTKEKTSQKRDCDDITKTPVITKSMREGNKKYARDIAVYDNAQLMDIEEPIKDNTAGSKT